MCIRDRSLGGRGDCVQNLIDLHIVPVSISYEYDPNDYLKVREFLMKRRNPDFKKSQRDDLFSMETGILKQKGRVHFRMGRCIDNDLQHIEGADRAEAVRKVCDTLDRAIHCGYRIFPCNYIAYDKVYGSDKYAAYYTPADVAAFEQYIEGQLDKVNKEVEGPISEEERDFMRQAMLKMYANPLKNQRAALDCESNC